MVIPLLSTISPQSKRGKGAADTAAVSTGGDVCSYDRLVDLACEVLHALPEELYLHVCMSIWSAFKSPTGILLGWELEKVEG